MYIYIHIPKANMSHYNGILLCVTVELTWTNV